MEDIIITDEQTATVSAPEAEPVPAPKPRSIYARLARAQGKFKPVVKNCINPAFKSRYADLQSILTAVRPALNSEGLYLYQDVESLEAGIKVVTIVASEDGEVLRSAPLFIPTGMKVTAQAFGSAETYGRRYGISAFLGIASEDDDDGNTASSAPAPAPAPRMRPELEAAAKAAAEQGMDVYKKFFASASIDDRRALNASGVHAACKAIAEGAGHE